MNSIPAKAIVYKNKSPSAWFGLDYNMNIYRGCSHGCIYCDSRSDCFQNPDFDTVMVKQNALQLVRDDLRRKVTKGVVSSGAMSDPYNPLEQELMLTRRSLELINAFGFGASLTTKSDLIARDADVLQDIASHSSVLCKISVTTADDGLSRLLEPNAPPTSARFAALHTLAAAGVFCGVFIIPMLPYVTDSTDNLVKLLQMAHDAGAKFVYTYMGMTLRAGSREYYFEHLDQIASGIKEKYISRFGMRKHCQSPSARKLWDVLDAECGRLGLLNSMKAITHAYRAGYGDGQLSIF